jgi:peroxiredoxin
MYKELQAQDTEVLVIGGGQRRSAAMLKKLLRLPFPVLADPDRSIYRLYDLEKVLFVIQRSGTFLVDRQGIVRYVHQATDPLASVNRKELVRAVEKLRDL